VHPNSTTPPTAPPDLELQVHLTSDSGSTALTYDLHSAVAGFHFERIPGPILRRDPEEFAASLFEQIEKLHARVDREGDPLLLMEIEEELASLGRSLYLELFPPAMQQAYRRFRHVRSIQITSDEPAIPWELIKPFDDSAEPVINDDFLCMRFQLTRWRNGRPPVPIFPVKKLACFGGTELPKAAEEHALLAGLATRHSGVANASPRTAFYESSLRTGRSAPAISPARSRPSSRRSVRSSFSTPAASPAKPGRSPVSADGLRHGSALANAAPF
jgi:hypothetical protein